MRNRRLKRQDARGWMQRPWSGARRLRLRLLAPLLPPGLAPAACCVDERRDGRYTYAVNTPEKSESSIKMR